MHVRVRVADRARDAPPSRGRSRRPTVAASSGESDVTIDAPGASPSAPFNDDKADASPLASGNGTLKERTDAATLEVGEPMHAGDTGGSSVWFSWTPNFTGTAFVNTFNSDFDTLLEARDPSTNVVLAANDDGSGSVAGPSVICFPVTKGSTVLLVADGYLGASGHLHLSYGSDLETVPCPGLPSVVTGLDGADETAPLVGDTLSGTDGNLVRQLPGHDRHLPVVPLHRIRLLEDQRCDAQHLRGAGPGHRNGAQAPGVRAARRQHGAQPVRSHRRRAAARSPAHERSDLLGVEPRRGARLRDLLRVRRRLELPPGVEPRRLRLRADRHHGRGLPRVDPGKQRPGPGHIRTEVGSPTTRRLLGSRRSHRTTGLGSHMSQRMGFMSQIPNSRSTTSSSHSPATSTTCRGLPTARRSSSAMRPAAPGRRTRSTSVRADGRDGISPVTSSPRTTSAPDGRRTDRRSRSSADCSAARSPRARST